MARDLCMGGNTHYGVHGYSNPILGRFQPDKDEPNWQKYLQTQPKKEFKSAVLSLDLFACGQQVAHSAVL